MKDALIHHSQFPLPSGAAVPPIEIGAWGPVAAAQPAATARADDGSLFFYLLSPPRRVHRIRDAMKYNLARPRIGPGGS